jgi:hypothetical protein
LERFELGFGLAELRRRLTHLDLPDLTNLGATTVQW